MNSNNRVDDGSLAFLNIPRDENNKSFNCRRTSQSDLVNCSFWVVDYVDGVQTQFTRNKPSEGQAIVLIKHNREDPDSKAEKFFTGSEQIKYVLRVIRERDAFPRKVTLRARGNCFYFE